MNLLTEYMVDMFKDILVSVFDWIGTLIALIHAWILGANQVPAVAAMCTFTMLLGGALSSIVVAKNIVCTYGFGSQGDSDQDASDIIFRLCLALGVMGANSLIFQELYKLTNAVSQDVTATFNNVIGMDIVSSMKAVIDTISSPANVIAAGSVVIAMAVYTLSATLRGAEITLSKILLPIFALDLINNNHEKWNMFIFQYIMSFLSFIVQQLCYQMFLSFFFSGGNLYSVQDYFVMFGWLVLAIKLPKWLEKYIYATGTGQAISHGAGRLGQVIMFVGMKAA